ncbi:DUF3368 domain-containing protein [Verrucomicrobia bacterium LW23]|nr:DUF3368 domain-containing protein [Verrucomicrobia bacterium LW23]
MSEGHVVVSDTTPLNYLVLTGAEELLPRLFTTIHVPTAVVLELSHAQTPAVVRDFIQKPPEWLQVTQVSGTVEVTDSLGPGETEAMQLALQLGIGAVLIDDKAARRIAKLKGLVPIGTLSILERAAAKGWIDFSEHIGRIGKTQFRLNCILVEEAQRRLDRLKGL